jgi:hypothetical protein
MSIKIVIEHTIEEINKIIVALAKQPFEEVHELIAKIRLEGQKQIAESQAKAQPLETPAPPAQENYPGA